MECPLKGQERTSWTTPSTIKPRPQSQSARQSLSTKQRPCQEEPTTGLRTQKCPTRWSVRKLKLDKSIAFSHKSTREPISRWTSLQTMRMSLTSIWPSYSPRHVFSSSLINQLMTFASPLWSKQSRTTINTISHVWRCLLEVRRSDRKFTTGHLRSLLSSPSSNLLLALFLATNIMTSSMLISSSHSVTWLILLTKMLIASTHSLTWRELINLTS